MRVFVFAVSHEMRLQCKAPWLWLCAQGMSGPTPEPEPEGATPFATFALERAREVVDGIPEERRIVLLGESTHGTEEFYRIRAIPPATSYPDYALLLVLAQFWGPISHNIRVAHANSTSLFRSISPKIKHSRTLSVLRGRAGAAVTKRLIEERGPTAGLRPCAFY